MARTRVPQSYQSHRRWHPPFHFFAVPILGLNVLYAVYQAVRHPSWESAWQVLVALAVLTGVVLARYYALTVQNRVIRIEETLRLGRCLPEEMRGRIGELSTRQLIALRFCADEELPDLTRAVLNREVAHPSEIKRRIKTWRGDWHRV